MPGAAPRDQAESAQRGYLRRILAQGAARLGAEITGPAVFGWRERTIGAPATRDGTRLWLRASGEREDRLDRQAWHGNLQAAALAGIPKPDLVDRAEWREGQVATAAELMTFVPDPPCSPTPEARAPLELSDAWWRELRTGLDALAKAPTGRRNGGSARYTEALSRHFATPIPVPRVWATEHTDLHWSNLTAPTLRILDWEYWGVGPAGLGAASLYCHSLLIPGLAASVHEYFEDVLETPTGRYSQLAVIMHMDDRIRNSDYPELAEPLQTLSGRLLRRIAREG